MAGFWESMKGQFIKSAETDGPPPRSVDPMGLEQEEEEVEPEIGEEEGPEPILNASGVPEIAEGRSFDTIGVPPSPYPVERLVTVIEGLLNMTPDQIRMVVAAMDAADKAWTIDDPVQDAETKIGVLRAEKAKLLATVQQIDTEGRTQARLLDEGLTATGIAIKAEIDALQTKLQAEVVQVSTQKAQIDAKIRGAQEASVREGLRLDTEIGRLIRIPNTFGTGLGGK